MACPGYEVTTGRHKKRPSIINNGDNNNNNNHNHNNTANWTITADHKRRNLILSYLDGQMVQVIATQINLFYGSYIKIAYAL